MEGISDQEAKALNIALNSPDAQGKYDEERLAGLLEELSGAKVDIPKVTGLDEKEISAFVGYYFRLRLNIHMRTALQIS